VGAAGVLQDLARPRRCLGILGGDRVDDKGEADDLAGFVDGGDAVARRRVATAEGGQSGQQVFAAGVCC
jgi:hypothetical protein